MCATKNGSLSLHNYKPAEPGFCRIWVKCKYESLATSAESAPAQLFLMVYFIYSVGTNLSGHIKKIKNKNPQTFPQRRMCSMGTFLVICGLASHSLKPVAITSLTSLAHIQSQSLEDGRRCRVCECEGGVDFLLRFNQMCWWSKFRRWCDTVDIA